MPKLASVNNPKAHRAAIALKYNRSPKGKAAFKARWESVEGRSTMMRTWVRNRARVKDIEFKLSREWFVERLTDGICESTGLEFDLRKHNKGCPQFYSPSVDKIDPKGGYTEDNCRMVIDGYNRGKGTASDDDMFALALGILEMNLA